MKTTLQEASNRILEGSRLVKESAEHTLPKDLGDYLDEFDGLDKSAGNPSFKLLRNIRGYDIYESSEIKYPKMFETMWTKLQITCEVSAFGQFKEKEDSYVLDFHWRYQHPGGGTNGVQIGVVFVEKASGKVVHVRKGS